MQLSLWKKYGLPFKLCPINMGENMDGQQKVQRSQFQKSLIQSVSSTLSGYKINMDTVNHCTTHKHSPGLILTYPLLCF